MAIWRLSFGGELYTDIWQCNLHMEGVAGWTDIFNSSDPNSSAGMDAVGADISKWFRAANITGSAKLNWVKMNEINPLTGAYISQTNTNEKIFPNGIGGSAATGGMPQLSLCISLLTGARRGPAARGRFYPPPLGTATISDTGVVSSAVRVAQATAAATLINDLNNWAGIDAPGSLEVVVLGKDGATRKVTQVAVGSVMDTQRRRRNKLREVYETRDI